MQHLPAQSHFVGVELLSTLELLLNAYVFIFDQPIKEEKKSQKQRGE